MFLLNYFSEEKSFKLIFKEVFHSLILWEENLFELSFLKHFSILERDNLVEFNGFFFIWESINDVKFFWIFFLVWEKIIELNFW